MSNMNAHAILNAAAATIDDRAAERDVEQERSMARAVDAFNSLTGHELSETEGWLFMVILKAARATAGAFQADDWIDMAGYVGLAGESAVNAYAEDVRREIAGEPLQKIHAAAEKLSKAIGSIEFGRLQEPSEQIMRESYGGTSD